MLPFVVWYRKLIVYVFIYLLMMTAIRLELGSHVAMMKLSKTTCGLGVLW